MSPGQYCVFVCTKKRPDNDSEGCCANAGGLDIYRAFQLEINQLQLGDRIQVRSSGCLDYCEAGAVAMVYQPKKNQLSWLPTKLRIKLKKILFPQRILYGHLTPADVKVIIESHFIRGKIFKPLQILSNK